MDFFIDFNAYFPKIISCNKNSKVLGYETKGGYRGKMVMVETMTNCNIRNKRYTLSSIHIENIIMARVNAG
mgnify:CR=1 FL=1